MSDELVNQSPESTPKPKRNYPKNRRSPNVAQVNIPNPSITALESDLLPLVRQRMSLASAVVSAQAQVNHTHAELQRLQNELAQIESAVQYQQQIIAQMKGIPFQPSPMQQMNANVGMGYTVTPARFADFPQPVPQSPMYTPAAPYPQQQFPQPAVTMPTPYGAAGSYPAPNRGLYPDAPGHFDEEQGIDVNDGAAVREPMSALEGRYNR